MNKSLYTAALAFVLAFAFPIYWVNEFFISMDDIEESIWSNISTLNLNDAFFVFVSAAPALICYLFMQKLHNDLNYKKLDILLWILIGVNLWLASTVSFDIATQLLSADTAYENRGYLVGHAMGVTAATLVIAGIVDIIIGVILLRGGELIPSILKVFGAITLVQGVFELTLVFSFVTLVVYPLALIVLGVYFLQEPESIEVV